MKHLLRSFWSLTCRIIPLVFLISCLMVWLFFTFFKAKVAELGLLDTSFGLVLAFHFGCCIVLYLFVSMLVGLYFFVRATMVSRRLDLSVALVSQAYFQLGLAQVKSTSMWTREWIQKAISQYQAEQDELASKRAAFSQRHRGSGEFIGPKSAS